MFLQSLSLQNFRNYKKRVWNFSQNTTVIVADNSMGKSNLLEAVYLLATGRSFRASKEEQMIFYTEKFGRVIGEVAPATNKLEVILASDMIFKKRYLINGVAKRRMDFIGNLLAVLFRPEDIELILGSPSLRREYLDSVLEQADREYRRSNLSYQKGLRQRNKLLEKIREGGAERKQLMFWDELLIRNGQVVSTKREEFLGRLNQEFDKKKLDLFLEYDKSVISPLRLEQYSQQEVAAGKTLVGPHRDNLSFFRQRKGKAKKDLRVFGSRGEQRLAVFNLKLAELEFMEAIDNEPPLLLLDDIFSELDHDNREKVLQLLDKQQTIITTTDEHLIPKKYQKKLETIKL